MPPVRATNTIHFNRHDVIYLELFHFTPHITLSTPSSALLLRHQLLHHPTISPPKPVQYLEDMYEQSHLEVFLEVFPPPVHYPVLLLPLLQVLQVRLGVIRNNAIKAVLDAPLPPSLVIDRPGVHCTVFGLCLADEFAAQGGNEGGEEHVERYAGGLRGEELTGVLDREADVGDGEGGEVGNGCGHEIGLQGVSWVALKGATARRILPSIQGRRGLASVYLYAGGLCGRHRPWRA